VQDHQEVGLIVIKAAESLMTVRQRERAKAAGAGVADTPGPVWGKLTLVLSIRAGDACHCAWLSASAGAFSNQRQNGKCGFRPHLFDMIISYTSDEAVRGTRSVTGVALSISYRDYTLHHLHLREFLRQPQGQTVHSCLPQEGRTEA
jgi:hypothetical protein